VRVIFASWFVVVLMPTRPLKAFGTVTAR
jgi:hypothetical protein